LLYFVNRDKKVVGVFAFSCATSNEWVVQQVHYYFVDFKSMDAFVKHWYCLNFQIRISICSLNCNSCFFVLLFAKETSIALLQAKWMASLEVKLFFLRFYWWNSDEISQRAWVVLSYIKYYFYGFVECVLSDCALYNCCIILRCFKFNKSMKYSLFI
jgi:hypothetical protein